MIFAIWFPFWLMTTSVPTAFLVPALSLATRSSYLGRPIRLGAYPLLLGLMVYLFYTIDLSKSEAFGLAIRTLLMLALVRHLLVSYNRSTAATAYIPGGSLFVVIVRSARSLREISDDIAYAAKVRRASIPSGPKGTMRRLQVDMSALYLLITEVMALITGYSQSITARGGLPDPTLWKERGVVHEYFYWGDALLFIVAALTALCPSVELAPRWVVYIAGEAQRLLAMTGLAVRGAP